jgi:protease-4
MAASGGYYISTAGRQINAEAATIAGSIGVVGGKVVIKGLLDTIGVNVETVSRGKRAGMLSPFAAFTPEERAFIGTQMNDTYQLFLKRVKTSRGAKIKSIDDVAQGRIFSGNAAVQAGLVDKIASLADTISAAARQAGLGEKYQVLTYPEPRTLSDILRQGFQAEARLPIEFRMALGAVPAAYRHETLRLLGLVEALRSERVMLALPAGIVEQ